MKPLFTLLAIVCFISANGQTFSEFPGSGFGLILPDSGFRPTEKGFGNEKYEASISLINLETDPDINKSSFETMDQGLAEYKSKDPVQYSKIYLLDTVIGNGRLIKILPPNDSSVTGQINKQLTGWFYYYKYKSFAVLIAGAYDSKYEADLHEPFLKSFLSFKVVDSFLADNFFKSGISITEDIAPLRHADINTPGILLNMQGKYPVTIGDSSYCRIVPVDLIFPLAKPDDVASYLRFRLSIHTKKEILLKQYTYTHGNFGNFRYYSVVKEMDDGRILFFCIKADERGYFEIWGEAYHNNKKLVDIFNKISDSLKRD